MHFISKFELCTNEFSLRNAGFAQRIPTLREKLLGLRAKVRIPTLRSAILSLRNFLVCAEHIYYTNAC